MIRSKKEIQTKCKDSKIDKKARRKKLVIWLLIDFLVAFAVICAFKYIPNRYAPDPNLAFQEPGQVSTYLTHKLLPQFNDGIQLGGPFEVEITQDGLNEIIYMEDWPKQSEGIMFYSPAALFVPGTVVLMGTANVKGVEFVITFELEPKITNDGLLNLHVAKVQVGAMNITSLAIIAAKKIYEEQLSDIQIDADTLQAKIASSLLDDTPFEPVFIVNKKKIRVESISIKHKQMIVRFVPIQAHNL
ncbi:MAG: hypothetical protein JW715_13385 [Sedimentisphaerales bacterium]|nr:hypothetical protein [Sedimentisphaerales bacterium]